MKHLLAALALVFSFNTMADTVDSKEYRVEKRIDTDLTVVEFTSKARPDYICIYVTGGNDGGVTCIPKKTEHYK